MQNRYLILFICYLFVNELIFKGTKESILIVVKNILFYRKEFAKQETPSYFINYINKNLNSIINYNKNYVLVDFGCGDGSTLRKLKICKKKIGIEIDKTIYNLALSKNKNNNIKFINDDICNYNFNKNTILYMYEPLWLCKDNLSIYNKLFKKINKSNKHIYIIYLTGFTKQLQEKHFQNYNFKLLHKYKHGSILLNRYIYIYSN